MKIFIPVLFVICTCYACTSPDKTTEMAKDSLSVSYSSTALLVATDKPLSDSFVVVGDSVYFRVSK